MMFNDHFDEDLDDGALLYDVRRGARAQAVRLHHMDPTVELSDVVFKQQFRFDKSGVRRLAAILDLDRENDRGRPLSPVQQLCVALNFYGGGHYTRVAGLCCGISQTGAWKCIDRVTNELCRIKGSVVDPELLLKNGVFTSFVKNFARS